MLSSLSVSCEAREVELRGAGAHVGCEAGGGKGAGVGLEGGFGQDVGEGVEDVAAGEDGGVVECERHCGGWRGGL